MTNSPQTDTTTEIPLYYEQSLVYPSGYKETRRFLVQKVQKGSEIKIDNRTNEGQSGKIR